MFIKNPCPEEYTVIDHINRIRSDNRLCNLRWVSYSENNKNKSSFMNIDYEFVEVVPDDTIVIDKYGNHELEFYYYSEEANKFYFYNGLQYRVLPICEVKNGGAKYVWTYNKEGKCIKVYLNQFKKIYDIPY